MATRKKSALRKRKIGATIAQQDAAKEKRMHGKKVKAYRKQLKKHRVAGKRGRKAGFKHSAATKKKISAALKSHHRGMRDPTHLPRKAKRKKAAPKRKSKVTNWNLYNKMHKSKSKTVKARIKKQLTKRRFYRVD